MYYTHSNISVESSLCQICIGYKLIQCAFYASGLMLTVLKCECMWKNVLFITELSKNPLGLRKKLKKIQEFFMFALIFYSSVTYSVCRLRVKNDKPNQNFDGLHALLMHKM